MKDFKKIREVAARYGLGVVRTTGTSKDGLKAGLQSVTIQARNTDGDWTDWITYFPESNTVSYDDTDCANIWLHETMPTLTPDDAIQMVSDINEALGTALTVKNLIDPEDWQEIAGVPDASEDRRYADNTVYGATEVCPHCETENFFEKYDAGKQGYVVKCKDCGREMMLCDACLHADDNPKQKCDWRKENGKSVCFRGTHEIYD